MTPYRRMEKNIELLDRLSNGDRVRVRDLQARGRRSHRVYRFVRRQGAVADFVGADGRPWRRNLMFVSCSHYRPAAMAGKSAVES